MRLYEIKNNVKSEVYIDMDGVLVDFFDAWAKLMKVDNFRKIQDIDKGLQAIRDEDDFWLKLKPTPNAGKLLALVRELKGSYTILSSPLADDPRSEPHKKMWVNKFLKQFPPKDVIITGNKAKYAQQSDGTPNILIDDFGKNIDKWNAAGGIGVKHKDHKFERTFKELMLHLKSKTEGKRIPRKKGQPANSKKHSDLYTDENPKGTIHGLKFATVKDAESSVSKIKRSGRSHAHKIQAAVAMEQRAKAAGKTSAAAVYRKYINSVKKTENFADGKVKGKSRPGRVKRSGASCDGSVTSLRKKAKNASGEKAKMYHWCANMKSGRKK